eukprot:m.119339 g.119339  ORF g.119339 m.119339 type:complete len:394 (+) comp13289_c0_seq1:267-1448(+)
MDAMTSRLFKDLGLTAVEYPKLATVEFDAIKSLSDEDLADKYAIADAALRHAILRKASENQPRPPSFGSGAANRTSLEEARRTSVAGRARAPLPPEAAAGQRPPAGARSPAEEAPEQDVSPKDLAPVARRSGWMCKQGFVVKNWKMRWCILDSKALYYFTTPQADRPKGVIPLQGYAAVEVTAAKKQHTFKLQHPTQRDWFFTCTDDTGMKKWIAEIQLVANRGAVQHDPSSDQQEDEVDYAPVIDDRTNFEIYAEAGRVPTRPGREVPEHGSAGSGPVSSDTAAVAVLSADSCPFFYEAFTREDAERRVPPETGAYLLRRAADGDVAVITGFWDADYRHFKLFGKSTGGYFLARTEPTFATQAELLEHYTTYDLPNALEGNPRLLKRPILRS